MLLCHPARADERPALTHLSWSVPAASGCIPARELELSVEALLGRKVFAERSAASQELVGVVGQREGEWFAVLRPNGATDNARELYAAGACSRLNRSLVFVVATLLDTWVDTVMPDNPRAALALGVVLDARSGTLPTVAIGARIVGLVDPGRYWPLVRGQLGAWLPERVLQQGMGARFRAYHVGLAACPLLVARSALSLAVCAGLELGALQAQALGLSSPRAPTRLLVSLPLEAALSIRLSEAAVLRVELGPTLAALRPRFYFDDADRNLHVVHRVALWGASARLGFIADLL